MNSMAISVLAEAGIRGIDAETGLRCVLAELAAPSPASRKALVELGLTVEELDPSTHRIVRIVRRLADAGIDEPTARAIFGERGTPAILALTDRVKRLEELQRPEP